MSKFFNNDHSSRQEMEAIRKDLESVVRHLGNLKGNAQAGLSDQLEDLYSTMSNLKNRGMSCSKEAWHHCYSYGKDHPVRTVLWAAGIGLLLSLMCKK